MAPKESIDVNKLTPAERDQLLHDVFDPTRVALACGRHHYFITQSPRPPVDGCSDCWLVYLTWIVAQQPPSRQREAIERLEALIRYLCEDPLALRLYERPLIEHGTK